MSELPTWAKRPREDAVATDSGWVVKNSKGVDELIVSHRGLKTKVDALYQILPDANKDRPTRKRKDPTNVAVNVQDVPETQAPDEIVLSATVEAAPIGSFLMTESTDIDVSVGEVEELEDSTPVPVEKPKPSPAKKLTKPVKRR